MKNLFLTFLLLALCAPAGAGDLFFKAGGGLIVSGEFSSTGSISSTYNRLVPVASASVGIDHPDNFSFFASGEWFPPMGTGLGLGDLAIMANMQFTFSFSNFIKPYLYAGIGLDISPQNPPFGLGLQFAIGAEFAAAKGVDFFLEGKSYGAIGFKNIANLNFWKDEYIPVLLTGLKFKL